MWLGRPYRALVLPMLAIIVPSAFIVVLGVEWVAVEQEAARLRGAEAAASALEELRGSLSLLLADTARTVAPTLRGGTPGSGSASPAWPAIVADAFLFDERGERGESAGPIGVSHSFSPAAEILAEGARANAAGQYDDVDRAAVRLMACCGSARDEFGVAYLVYGAWQRLSLEIRRPDPARRAAVVSALREAIERGLLAQPGDVVSVRLLADALGDHPGARELLSAAERKAAEVTAADETRRAARAWLASLDWTAAAPATPVLIAPWRSGESATLAAAWRVDPTERVVFVVNPRALSEWVSHASNAHAPFVFRLERPGDEETARAVLTAPLVAEAPAVVVSVRRGPDDPTAGQRERLFMTAAGMGVLLTLSVGYFAARDVYRELRTASMRSTFLAGVTHDIKTPLTSIRLLAETLQQGRGSAESSKDILSTIVGETEHLSALVDNVLGTARIESGTRTYQTRLVSVCEVVRAARRRFDYMLAKEGFTVVESIPAAPLWARLDPEALAQAVLNLLSNAIKYSGASREIRLVVTADGPGIHISVGDNGVGIPADEQASIFESFYRSGRTASGTSGSGLGLALVKHFADAHGGSVSVASDRGKGSVFTITLPGAGAPELEGSRSG